MWNDRHALGMGLGAWHTHTTFPSPLISLLYLHLQIYVIDSHLCFTFWQVFIYRERVLCVPWRIKNSCRRMWMRQCLGYWPMTSISFRDWPFLSNIPSFLFQATVAILRSSLETIPQICKFNIYKWQSFRWNHFA